MPLHDWSGTPAGVFHDFHQGWSIRIRTALNAGRLPPGYLAMVEQKAGPKEGDVIAIEIEPRLDPVAGGAVTAERPATRIVRQSTGRRYADMANRVVVKHRLGRTVAVIELVSPGNKDSERAFKQFVTKIGDYVERGVHVLVVDVFPPTPRDPYGVHKGIWDQFVDEPFVLPTGQDRVLAAYHADVDPEAFVETMGVGDPFLNMPLFLADGKSIPVPLEATYQAEWDGTPEFIRQSVLAGEWPAPAADE